MQTYIYIITIIIYIYIYIYLTLTRTSLPASHKARSPVLPSQAVRFEEEGRQMKAQHAELMEQLAECRDAVGFGLYCRGL